MKNKMIRIVLIFVLVWVLIALFFVSLVSVFLIFANNDSDVSENIPSSEKMQYFRLNTITNESSSGIVEYFNQGQAEEQYFSYNNDGNYVLISEFGLNEYACVGSCHCFVDMEEVRRTTSMKTISKGVLYLVAAASSVFAHDQARKYFSGQCSEPDNECSEISSELEYCEQVTQEETTYQENQFEPKERMVGVEEKKDIRRYICKGNCIPRNFKNEIPRRMASEFGCESLHLTGEVEIDCIGLGRDMTAFAICEFRRDQLVPFCQKRSAKSYLYTWPTFSNYKKKWREVFLCVGSKGGNYNSSVHCRQSYPKYKTKLNKSALLRHWDN